MRARARARARGAERVIPSVQTLEEHYEISAICKWQQVALSRKLLAPVGCESSLGPAIKDENYGDIEPSMLVGPEKARELACVELAGVEKVADVAKSLKKIQGKLVRKDAGSRCWIAWFCKLSEPAEAGVIFESKVLECLASKGPSLPCWGCQSAMLGLGLGAGLDWGLGQG